MEPDSLLTEMRQGSVDAPWCEDRLAATPRYGVKGKSSILI